MSVTTSSSQDFLDALRAESKEVTEHSVQALLSFAWLWPFKGILYTLTHPNIILSVKGAFLKSLLSSSLVFTLLAVFTYVPQAAFLSVFTGFLGPILALFLVGAESIFLFTLLCRALFLEPALTQVFDSTLLSQGQVQLVKHGRTKYAAGGGRVSDVRGALVRPFQGLSRDGMIKYLVTLPLNLVPIIGTISFLFLNGYRAGPGWHARYFQLKGFDKTRRKSFVQKRRAEYTAFGMATMLLTFVPFVGLLFSFTNTVGAALWAAEIEARANLLGSESAKPKTE